MNRWRWLAGIALALGAAALISLVNSCSTLSRTVMAPPEIEGATFVGDRVCMDCHSNISRAFPASPHARLHLEQAGLTGQQGCEACHGPASKHVMVGGGRGKFIVNPGKDPAACFQCHLDTHAEFNLPQHHPVIEGKMNCVQCHDPHGISINAKMLLIRDNNLCLRCHAQTVSQGMGSIVQPGHIFIGKQDHTALLAHGACWSSGCHNAVHGSNINPYWFY